MTSGLWLAFAALLPATGALVSLLVPRRVGFAAGTIIAALAGLADLVLGLMLIAGRTMAVTLYRLYPFGPLTVRADGLSGLLLVLSGVLVFAIAVYAWGYMPPFGNQALRAYGLLVHLLLLAILGIVVAGDVLLFVVAWEVMAITSYLLTTLGADQDDADAGFLMLAISQAGTVAFLIAFLLISASAHTLQFAGMHVPLSAGVHTAAFLLFLFGFGTKAGVIPFHIWQPPAYAAAPGPVSAILSGILVNLGVYGIVRFAIVLLRPWPLWWGIAVASVGAISALLGILYALSERDLKRFLAYSSVENIGIILIGLGTGMVFLTGHLRALAALAFIAALFHTLNHATSKGLLFLCAGSVHWATDGERNMDRLGGLLRRIPWTSALFLVGALSIAAVPPFNGFVSEWLTLESLLQSYRLVDLAAKVWLAGVGAFLALTAGLAVTAFVKAYGISFLGIARSERSAEARPIPDTMRAGMVIAALAAVLLGVLPTAFIPWFGRVAAAIAGPNITGLVVPPVYTHPGQNALLVHLGSGLFRPLVPAQGPTIVPASASFAATTPTFLAVSFIAGIVVVGVITHRLSKRVRQVEVWAGGIDHFTPNYQYTSTGYANPIRIIFGTIYRPGRETRTEVGESEYFRLAVTYRGFVVPFFERRFYPALLAAANALGNGVKVFQSGNVNLYLGYIFAVLVLVLIFVR